VFVIVSVIDDDGVGNVCSDIYNIILTFDFILLMHNDFCRTLEL
jgi:hypothetical protein